MKFYYCAICFLTVLCLSGQELKNKNNDSGKTRVSLHGGVSINNVKQNLSNLIYSKYSGSNGFFASTNVEYQFIGPFIASTGISILQKNFKFEKTASKSFNSSYNTDYETLYFNVPIMIGVYLINPYKEKGIKLSISGGGFLGKWLKLTREGRYNKIFEASSTSFNSIVYLKENYDFDTNQNNFNRFDYGLQGEAKLLYDFSSHYGVSLGYTYLHGFSNIYKKQRNEHPIKHKTSITSLGISYKF
ncbi:porin family protein [Aquimarina longa]|uniref:porin family protein n=1 Tax=Aquimarina longa TaxID=1080221 RepID=UPI000783B1D4|nr:porin family protein [Aquimarina longa]